MNTFFVYVLFSERSGRRYIGSCGDLNERIRRHNAGDSKATRHAIPWVLVYQEQFETRSEAVRRERFLKTGRGREELDKILLDRGVAQPG